MELIIFGIVVYMIYNLYSKSKIDKHKDVDEPEIVIGYSEPSNEVISPLRVKEDKEMAIYNGADYGPYNIPRHFLKEHSSGNHVPVGLDTINF
jgi:hypothetical protein